METKKVIIANWKMSLNLEETVSLAKNFKKKFTGFTKGEVVICPSLQATSQVADIIGKSRLKLGAQNVFWEENGAYTGEVSPSSLIELGCEYVILGHSERRTYLLENYEMINKKIKAVMKAEKITPVVCIGENWKERNTDRRDFVLVEQLWQALSGINFFGRQRIIIAYEPIWAIGTGTAIKPDEAEYAHKIIKLALTDMFGLQVVNENFRIIYGGSINPQNVKGFVDLENLDGLLVGGCSLKADHFLKVVKAITR